MMNGLDERKVQRIIMDKIFSQSMIICPNYTPVKWFECDMFAVTKAGYFHEYEIKLSISDLKNDAKKMNKYIWSKDKNRYELDWKKEGMTKHDRLSQGDVNGPVCFNFVTPEGLVEQNEVPDFAGLIELRGKWNQMHQVKKAPRLHKKKIDDGVLSHLRNIFYYRYWSERRTVDELKRNIESIKQNQKHQD